MTPEELDEIRARVIAATPGPWKVRHHPMCKEGVASVVHIKDDLPWKHVIASDGKTQFPADADFIAHSITDIPTLLAEIDRLRERATVEEANGYCARGHEFTSSNTYTRKVCRECDKARRGITRSTLMQVKT